MQRVMAPRGLARCLATDTAARTRRAPRGRHVVVPRSMGVVGRANVRRAWWGAAGLPGASTTSGAVSPGAWGRSAGGSCPPQGRGPRVAARAAGHGPARAGCARPGAPPPTAWALGAARPGPGPRRPRPGAASAPPAARRQGGPAQAPATRPSPGRAHLSAPGGGPRPHARGHGRQAVPSASVRGAPLCRRAAGGLAGRAQRASPGVAVLGLGAVRQVPVGLGPGGQALDTLGGEPGLAVDRCGDGERLWPPGTRNRWASITGISLPASLLYGGLSHAAEDGSPAYVSTCTKARWR